MLWSLSLRHTSWFTASFSPGFHCVFGQTLRNNIKDVLEIVQSQKYFVINSALSRCRTGNFGLEGNERGQVLGICRKREKTWLWKGWKKKQTWQICPQASSLLFWNGSCELISSSPHPKPNSCRQSSWRSQEVISLLPVLPAYRGNLMLPIEHECAHPISLRQVGETKAKGSCSAKQPYHDTHLRTSVTRGAAFSQPHTSWNPCT